jgi:hypothetical protein
VNAAQVLEGVQAIVAEIAGAHRTPSDAGPETPLGEDGFWLDSIDVLEVILACRRSVRSSTPTRASPPKASAQSGVSPS